MGVPYAEVIGDPVAHSKSPLIHNFWLEKLGLSGEFRKARVTREELGAYLIARRGDPDWRGCSVTIPHKRTIMPLLDDCLISWSGAVNCVVPDGDRLIGYNTDTTGIECALPEYLDTRDPVCIIGAGGAAWAAVAVLDMPAVYQFNIIARDLEKGRALVAVHGQYGRVFGFDQARQAIEDCVGLINASPLGMTGFDPMPASILDSLAELSPNGFVVDLVYAPVQTELLRRAADLGLHVGDGLAILVGQAEEAFSHFFGASPPREHDDALREMLTR